MICFVSPHISTTYFDFDYPWLTIRYHAQSIQQHVCSLPCPLRTTVARYVCLSGTLKIRQPQNFTAVTSFTLGVSSSDSNRISRELAPLAAQAALHLMNKVLGDTKTKHVIIQTGQQLVLFQVKHYQTVTLITRVTPYAGGCRSFNSASDCSKTFKKSWRLIRFKSYSRQSVQITTMKSPKNIL